MSNGKLIQNNSNKRVLVLGANGMLGNTVLRFFAASPGYQVFASALNILRRCNVFGLIRRT